MKLYVLMIESPAYGLQRGLCRHPYQLPEFVHAYPSTVYQPYGSHRMNNLYNRCSTWATILGLFFILSGCTENQVTTQKPGSLKDINTILVLTFDDVTASRGEKGLIKCPLCGNYFEAGPVPADTTDRLTQSAIDKLRKKTDIPLLVHDRTFNDRTDTLPERRFLTEAGKMAGADAVFTGYVYRYECGRVPS